MPPLSLSGQGRQTGRRFFPLALRASALFLLATVDDRPLGKLDDEVQMGFAAVALAETGSLAIAVEPSAGLPVQSGKGQWFSRFGIGNSLVQVPASLLAYGLERRLGPGSSNSLFLVAPILLVLAAGLAAARLARLLGGPPLSTVAALLLTVVASPLAAYCSTLLSEPLQAASLAGTLLFSLSAALKDDDRHGLILAALAGLSVSSALLAKSLAGSEGGMGTNASAIRSSTGSSASSSCRTEASSSSSRSRSWRSGPPPGWSPRETPLRRDGWRPSASPCRSPVSS